jgi:hypothetical protein
MGQEEWTKYDDPRGQKKKRPKWQPGIRGYYGSTKAYCYVCGRRGLPAEHTQEEHEAAMEQAT